jgi:hypothetical protein
VTGPLWGAQLAPFELEVRLRLGLPVTPDLGSACDIRIAGSPSLSVAGPLGDIVTPFVPFFRDFVAAQALPQLRDGLNRAVPPAVAAAFGLDDLPPGAVASLRQLEITPMGITLAPTIGAFGDTLSTFKP